jgi:hypothetical protein
MSDKTPSLASKPKRNTTRNSRNQSNTMSKLLDLINKRKGAFNRVKTLKAPAGRSRYRILPSWRFVTDDEGKPVLDPATMKPVRDTEQQFWADFGQHFIKDAAGEIKAVHVCADKTFNRPCPVCEAISQGILASTDDLTKRRLEEARSGARVLLNVLHLDGPNPNEVQILEVPPSVFNGKKGVGGILSLFGDWPSMVKLGDKSEGCCEVIIEKNGSGKEGTSYGVSAIPASTKLDASVLDRLHDLDAFVMQESEQSTQRALTGVSAISGLLPAPASAAPAYRAAAPAAAASVSSFTLDEEQDDALRTVEMGAVAAPAAPAAPVKAAAPAAPVAADDDLEALLSDLN